MDTLQPLNSNEKGKKSASTTMDCILNNENVAHDVSHHAKYNLFILCFVSSIGAIMLL